LREEKKLRAKQPSKCFVSLENTSKVQDPISKRNRVKTPYERKHPAIKAKIERNKELGIIPPRELQSLNDRITAGKKVKQSKEEKFDFQKDLWADEVPKKVGLNSEWINENVKIHHLKNTGEDIVKVPQISHERRSKLKAVDAIPGTSYNPLKEDYEKLIDTVVEKEVEVIKKQEKLNRALKPLYQKITKSESKRRRREEMRQGFPLNSADENESDEVSDSEYKPLNPPVRNKKKDLQKRRKQKEHKKREAGKELEKQELKKLNDLGM
jgi:nucleolar protein 53